MDKKELEKQFIEFKKRPVAFIGSGISRRYMSTCDWNGLLKMIFNEYNTNSAEYGQLVRENNKDLTAVASIVELEYNRYFSKNVAPNSEHKDYDIYVENKKTLDDGDNNITPFKLYVAKYFKNAKVNDVFQKEKNAFCKFLNACSNVITTNYDNLIENISDLKPIIGHNRFVTDDCAGYGELYKIHGDCNCPESLIITNDDYQRINNKNSIYHAKLLMSFVEQPIIFLGYSITDEYIENILRDVSENLSDEQLNILSKRIIFVEYSTTEEEISTFRNKKIEMTRVKTNDFVNIYEMVTNNVKVGIPLSLIRMFKEAVKNFVYDEENPEAIPVCGLEDIESDDVQAFYIGKEIINDNSSLFDAKDLFNDVLYNTGNLPEADKILNIIKMEHMRFPKESFLPLYKYYVNSTKKLDLTSISNKIIKDKSSVKSQTKKYIVLSYDDLVKNLKEAEEFSTKMYLLCNTELLNPELLRDELLQIHPKPFQDNKDLDTNYRKLICLLDFMENKKAS